MDASRELKVDKFALNKYSTELRKEFNFVPDLNSMAVQSAAEGGWFAISRLYDNCKSKKSGKKATHNFQKIVEVLNTKHQDGSYTQPKDVSPLPVKKV
jgi:putative transposase